MRKQYRKFIIFIAALVLIFFNAGSIKANAASTQTLAPFFNLRWSQDKIGYVQFDVPDFTESYYAIRVTRLDEGGANAYWYTRYEKTPNQPTLEYYVGDFFNQRGSYFFEVERYTKAQRDNYVSFEEGVASIPSGQLYFAGSPYQLPRPTNIQWNKKKGIVTWDAVPFAKGYEVVYKNKADNTQYQYIVDTNYTRYSSMIEENRPGIIMVRALSGYLGIFDNSPFSEPSYQDMKRTKNDIEKLIDNMYAKINTADLTTVFEISNTDSYILSDLYMKDINIKNKLDVFDALYAQKFMINTKYRIDPDLGIDASKVRVQLANLEAGAVGDNVTFNLHKPYTSNIPLNNAMYSKGIEVQYYVLGEMHVDVYKASPILYVTMPVPQGFDINKLVILDYWFGSTHHGYHYEEPVINDDGTISFVLLDSGEFVIAEKNDGMNF